MTGAKRYNNIKIIISLIELGITVALLIGILISGLSVKLADFAESKAGNPYLVLLLYAALLGMGQMFLLFPINFYSGFILEHKFQLSNQSLFQWAWEGVKGLMLSIVLFTPILVVFYFLLRNLRFWWWLPLGGILFLFSIFLTKIAPILIFPFFYKFEPLEDQALKTRLMELCNKIGFKVEGVFRFNLSKDTRKANAGFTGLGRTKRIILSDTLLDNFSGDEIETIFGHELAHFKFGHVWKGMVLGFFNIFIGLYVTALLYQRSLSLFGFQRVDEIAALPLLTLYLMLFGLVTMPLQNAISRWFERKADRFTLELTGKKDAFISSLHKLAELNLADAQPQPVIEFLFYSHPAIAKRIALVVKSNSMSADITY